MTQKAYSLLHTTVTLLVNGHLGDGIYKRVHTAPSLIMGVSFLFVIMNTKDSFRGKSSFLRIYLDVLSISIAHWYLSVGRCECEGAERRLLTITHEV